jgi:hypothetical protein
VRILYTPPSLTPTGDGVMSDDLRDLPKFPTDESKQYEEALRKNKVLPERPLDWLRHAWPVYLIFGGLFGLWVIAITVLALTGAGLAVFIVVLLPALVAIRIAGRFWWGR